MRKDSGPRNHKIKDAGESIILNASTSGSFLFLKHKWKTWYPAREVYVLRNWQVMRAT